MSRSRTTVRNEIGSEPSIRNEDSTTSVAEGPHQQSPTAQATEAFQLLSSKPMIIVFLGFIGHSLMKLAEMKEDAQNEGILIVDRVEAWIVAVTELFKRIEICCRHNQKMYRDHCNKNLLEAINQLLGYYKMLGTLLAARRAQH